MTEAYRAFRTLLLLSRAGGLKSVVVTSAVPGEGKTTTAINLAVTLAQLGKRTILFDADLHKPRVHTVLKISNRKGLVSLLAEGLKLEDVLQPTPVPNLWVVPAGPLTPNPSGLLASDAMAHLLEEVHAAFDYLVFDSPPVQPVADALLLGAATDGVVMAVKGGKTSREVVAKAKLKLQRANVRILGVLINNLRIGGKGLGGYSPYAKYEYGYGYGYGEGREPEKTPSGAFPMVKAPMPAEPKAPPAATAAAATAEPASMPHPRPAPRRAGGKTA